MVTTRDVAGASFFRCVRCGELFGVHRAGEAEAHVKEHEAADAREFPGGHTHATDDDADTCLLCFPEEDK